MFDTDTIEKRIGYIFNDKQLLRQCFVHSSYANENKGEKDNEKLEFLGDAIIKFIETEYLYNLPVDSEGELTKERQKIENNAFFLNTIQGLGLDYFVFLGKGQIKNLNHKEKLYASIYESLVAGIYLDGGMDCAKKFIYRTVIAEHEKHIKCVDEKIVSQDAKSTLQEYVQRKKLGTIKYETIEKTGPDHSPTYRVSVCINEKRFGEGKGKSKKIAETVAADVALTKLKNRKGKKFEF